LSNIDNELLTPGSSLLVEAAAEDITKWLNESKLQEQAGGVGDGSVWCENMAEAKLPQLADVAQTTILQLPAKAFQNNIEHLDNMLGNYRQLCERCGMSENSKLKYDTTVGISKQAWATFYSALLVLRWQMHKGDPSKMKSSVTMTRKTLSESPAIREQIHPAILEMVERAFRFRRVDIED
jgi:hypothetical protein